MNSLRAWPANYRALSWMHLSAWQIVGPLNAKVASPGPMSQSDVAYISAQHVTGEQARCMEAANQVAQRSTNSIGLWTRRSGLMDEQIDGVTCHSSVYQWVHPSIALHGCGFVSC